MALQTDDVTRFTETVSALTTEVRTMAERVKNLESNTAALNQSVAVLSDRSDRSMIIFDKLERTLSNSKMNRDMDWVKILKYIGAILAIATGGIAGSEAVKNLLQ